MKHTLKAVAATGQVLFGTSGVRGLVSAMTDTICQAYVSAFLHAVVPQAPKILMGCDLRPSSPTIMRACAAAIRAVGREVVFAGVLPTPALAFYAFQHCLPAVMITGSHIPFDRNGIKFYRHDGEIDKTDEARILAQTVHLPNPCTMPLPAVEAAVLRAYQDRYQAFFPDGFLRGRRIAVFQHSSVARDLLVDLLNWFGADTVAVGRSDVFVPVDTEAVGEETQALGRAWASEHQVDAILSTDGDADRPLIADESGKWLRGDTVGLLCARYLRAHTVVTPVSSTTAIERCSAFDTVMRTRIGSPYVIAAMNHALAKGQKAVVGFEANGGFLVGDEIRKDGRHLEALPTRDAVLPMLALLALAHESGVPLSRLAAGLPQRFTASDRIQGVPTAHSRTLIVRLATSPAAVARWLGEAFGAPVAQDETDGLRLTFSNGEIIHLRPSGNAPELRCYAEAASEARAKALVRHALERINRP
ncbi:MAG: phosphomannomutase [Clostridia bacterium]|nr:phosphomannomutase [Clostridia bacterium]